MLSSLDGSNPTKARVSHGLNAGFDGSPVSILSEKLTLTNYCDWAQAILLVVGGHGKDGYLTNKKKMPSDPLSTTMTQWKMDSSLVCSWLVNAMSPQLKRSFMYLPTAQAIWEAVRASYADAKDHSRLFDIRRRTWRCVQGRVLEAFMNTGLIWLLYGKS